MNMKFTKKVATTGLVISLLLNIFFAIFLILPGAGNQEQFVNYLPVERNSHSRSIEDAFLISSEELNKEHVKNVLLVLQFYNKDFKFINGQLKIPPELWEDKDYMANITSKANDSTWLANRNW